MGQGHSAEQALHGATTERISHILTQRFAQKCFTPLEIVHFKDVFKTLADQQDGISYWKEETLCRFLVVPDVLATGPMLYQMATYLGAFPFASTAPCILTLEALLKVVVIMTERYDKVLKGGKKDRNRLLFRSMAVFDRKLSMISDKPNRQDLESIKPGNVPGKAAEKSATGYSVDEPGPEDEDEDDDLPLAALEALEIGEVSKDNYRDTKIANVQIPPDNFRSLIMLLLVIAQLSARENMSVHAAQLTKSRVGALRNIANSILWTFTPEDASGITYSTFNQIVPASLPFLFDGFNPLFEHFLFSKNIDLSRHKVVAQKPVVEEEIPRLEPLLPKEGEILTYPVLSQLSFFLRGENLFRRLRPLYSGAEAGFSIGSFEQKVINWRAPTILLVAGTRLPETPADGRERSFANKLPPKRFPSGAAGNSKSERVVFGAYLNTPWRQSHKEAIGDQDTLLFQLEPVHEVFHASTVNRDYATFTKIGISFGCPPPRAKPVSGLSSAIALGPLSLLLDDSLEFGCFTHDSNGGGAFRTSGSRKSDWQDRFEIGSLEVWGCGGDEEAERQRKAWEFEEREAAARRGITLGKDKDADYALLEMAGLVGGHGNSGGSMA